MRTLYMSPLSPYTRKVRVMLAEKGLEYQNQQMPFDRLQNDYGNNINPCGRVPGCCSSPMSSWTICSRSTRMPPETPPRRRW